jgi:DNA-binding SARP family transcriptional activator
MTRLRRATHAFAAIAAAAAVLLGVPLALIVTVGWPLPTTIPAWSHITTALRGGNIPDAVVVHTLACIVWVAWAELALAFAWELAVNVSRLADGRPAHPAPAVVNHHLTALASRVIAVALTVTIATRPQTAGPLPAARPAAVTAPLVPPRPATPGPARSRPITSPSWVVHPGETLWGITERATGSPDRLGEVLALNAGQLTRPRDLRVGMVLTLPPGATVPADHQPAPPAADVTIDHTHTVTVGENLWTISAADLRTLTDPAPSVREIAPFWEEVITANRRHVPNPNLIYPGQTILLPPAPDELDAPAIPRATMPAPVSRSILPVPAPPPTPRTAPPAPAPSRPAVTQPRPGPPPTHSRAGADGEHDAGFDGWALPAGLTGATLLATWAAVDARRRRSRRIRAARGGSTIPDADPALAPIAAAVRTCTNHAATDRLDACLRLLASEQLNSPRPHPQLILRHTNGDIEVFLAEPDTDPPPPWAARATGRIWALPATATFDDPPDTPAPCPALVQLGTCDDGALLYADLEALGALGLAGTPETVRQIARALVATLVVSPAAAHCRILTTGFDPSGLEYHALTRLQPADSIDALLAEADATARPIRQALGTSTLGSSFALRAAQPDEAWEPAIVIAAGRPLDPDTSARLAEIAGPGGRGAAIAYPSTDAPWMLEPDPRGGWWRLDPIGIRLRPVSLAADELRDLAGYLAEADAEPAAPSGPDVTEPTAVHEPVDERNRTSGDTIPEFVERDWQVMVRLLGPVDLVHRDGRSATGERDQSLELLAWLVTHRDHATRSGAMEAMWGGRRVEARTFINIVSRARNLLRSLAGEPPDGGEWIPTRREFLILHHAVVSDYDLLLDRLGHARRVPPDAAAAVLSDGASLVRGAPLTGAEWEWGDDQSLRSRYAIQTVELATHLARLRLAAGDLRGAAEAAEIGHTVIPFHDECTALAIEALAQGGDHPAARARYDDYERRAMTSGEPVAPEVARVRNHLLRT